METIPLLDAIRALRGEILAANEEAQGHAVRFALGPIEMEFQVVAQRELAGNVNVRFHILSVGANLGASGKRAEEGTQRVKFVLNPVLVDETGERSEIEIARKEQPDEAKSLKQTLGRD